MIHWNVSSYSDSAGSVFVKIWVKLDPIWHQTPAMGSALPTRQLPHSHLILIQSKHVFFSWFREKLLKVPQIKRFPSSYPSLSNYHLSLTYDTCSSKNSSSKQTLTRFQKFLLVVRFNRAGKFENKSIRYHVQNLLSCWCLWFPEGQTTAIIDLAFHLPLTGDFVFTVGPRWQFTSVPRKFWGLQPKLRQFLTQRS